MAVFLPQFPLAFAQLMVKTKVPLMPLGVAWFQHWLPQGYSIQGQPLWQMFAKAQGDLHFCLCPPTWASSNTVELGLVNCRIQNQT